jgi:hypothetical protein
MDLTTNYLGITLKNPIVPSSTSLFFHLAFPNKVAVVVLLPLGGRGVD